MDKFFGLLSNENDIVSNFQIDASALDGIEIIYAEYDCEYYEGNAFILFRKDGKLYEVNGSHCSCNGLEEQWEPEETTLAAMLARPNVPEAAKSNLKELFS